jgi:3,4-dihydroxy 2-butanone 4-phosphate synthase/GTP cyclohydrolase II
MSLSDSFPTSKDLTWILHDDLSNHHDNFYIVSDCSSINPNLVNKFTFLTGGIFTVTVSKERASSFDLKPMRVRELNATNQNENSISAMLASVESRHNVTTGISASDRAQTLRVLASNNPNPRDLVSPGHIFPVLAKSGGILENPGVNEAAIELMRIHSLNDCALTILLIDENGISFTTSKSEDLSKELCWPIIKISSLVQHRLASDSTVKLVTTAKLPTEFGEEFTAYAFHSDIYQGEHVALILGDIKKEPVLTRVQSEATISDVFGGNKSREQLHKSLELIKKNGAGVLIYLRKNSENALSELLTKDPTQSPKMSIMRNYGIGAQIIKSLGINKINLITTSPKSIEGLNLFGVEISTLTILK